MRDLTHKEVVEQLEGEIERLNNKINGMYAQLAEARQNSSEAWTKLWKIEEIIGQLNELA